MDLIMAKIPLWERVEIILATSEHTFVKLQTCLEAYSKLFQSTFQLIKLPILFHFRLILSPFLNNYTPFFPLEGARV